VGAAAEGPRPRTGQASSGSSGGRRAESRRERAAKDVDPEELRYAPRPPSRWRWVRRLVALALVVAVVVAGALYAYRWTQDQYYVAASDGKVTIFRGVQADLPLVTLTHIDEVTDIELDTLPAFRAEQVRGGLEASSRANAEQIVENLRELSTPVPTPSPSPSPSPSRSGAADDEEQGT
jgi:protein phosphatase